MKFFFAWLLAVALMSAAGISNAADVLLGPGDVLKVSVYGNPDLGLETRVSEAGKITFPLIGEVIVGGLSSSAAEKKIADLLERGGFLRKAQVNIIVTLLQSQQVSVLGQVNRPGRYPIESKRDLMDVLALAGGISADGGDVVTRLRVRDGKTEKMAVDVIDMIRSGDMKKNFDVTSGDILYVERAAKVYVYGEVQRPGVYRLERNMTVLQLLSVGGGLTPRGTERNVRIKRRDAEGNLQVIRAKHDDIVQVDDVMYVQESLF